MDKESKERESENERPNYSEERGSENERPNVSEERESEKEKPKSGASPTADDTAAVAEEKIPVDPSTFPTGPVTIYVRNSFDNDVVLVSGVKQSRAIGKMMTAWKTNIADQISDYAFYYKDQLLHADMPFGEITGFAAGIEIVAHRLETSAVEALTETPGKRKFEEEEVDPIKKPKREPEAEAKASPKQTAKAEASPKQTAKAEASPKKTAKAEASPKKTAKADASKQTANPEAPPKQTAKAKAKGVLPKAKPRAEPTVPRPKAEISTDTGDDVPMTARILLQQDNPKKRGGMAFDRYEKYKVATTKQEYFDLGGCKNDWPYDFQRKWITVLDN